MSKEIKNTEIEEGVDIDFIDVEEVETGFISKVKSVIKKNGKKIVAGAAIGVGMIAAYNLGKRSGNISDIIDDNIDEIDTLVEEITTE